RCGPLGRPRPAPLRRRPPAPAPRPWRLAACHAPRPRGGEAAPRRGTRAPAGRTARPVAGPGRSRAAPGTAARGGCSCRGSSCRRRALRPAPAGRPTWPERGRRTSGSADSRFSPWRPMTIRIRRLMKTPGPCRVSPCLANGLDHLEEHRLVVRVGTLGPSSCSERASAAIGGTGFVHDRTRYAFAPTSSRTIS
ncbi:unnamed protein product, partial [Prorocentrum cordatum]